MQWRSRGVVRRRQRRARLVGIASVPVGVAGLVLVVSVGLCVWLLLEPRLISGLPLVWRLPLIVLGVWALGGGLAMPLQYADAHGWWRLVGTAPWYPLALGVFTLVLVYRGTTLG